MADRRQQTQHQVAPPRHLPAPTTSMGRARIATGIRRNLFQQQLVRQATTSTSSSTSSTDTTSTSHGIEFEPAADINIVVRNKRNDIEVFDPLPLIDDDGGLLDNLEEARRERNRLAENVRQLFVARGHGEDDEFLDALRASLKANVASLDEDNWMYEAEYPPRNQ